MQLRAGVSRVVITPPLDAPYAPSGEWSPPQTFDDVTADTYARAVVLHGGDSDPVALVSVEMIEAHEPAISPIRSEIERRTGIPAHNVLVVMTHTHCAPALMRPLYPYVKVTQQKIADAVVLAQKKLAPAQIEWAMQEIPGPATNRRILLKNGSVWPRFFLGQQIPTRETAASFFSGTNYAPNVDYRQVPTADEIVGPGPVNRQLTVMRILNEEENSLLGSVVHYACHASAALESHNIHGDFPGFACANIEGSTGVPCLFLPGASANINCNAFLTARTDAEAQRLGAEFSQHILTLLAKQGEPTGPSLACESIRISLPLREEMNPELNRKLRADLNGKPDLETKLLEAERVAREIEILAGLGREGVFPSVLSEGKIDCEIAAVQIGCCLLLTIPGELFVETGGRLEQAAAAHPALVVTHCNGGAQYIPEPAAFGQGGYEDAPSYASFVGPESEQQILAGFRMLLSRISKTQTAEQG